MDNLLVISHVITGFVGLLTGYLVVLTKKGNKTHRAIGKVYLWSMVLAGITALLIMVLFRFQFFLFAIAVFSLYLVLRGYTMTLKKRTLDPKWYDHALLIWILAGALGMTAIGVYAVMKGNMMAIACFLFGAIAFSSAWTEFKMIFKRPEVKRTWWLQQHISAMMGSFIAANTAFLVQNGRWFHLPETLGWIFWVAPTAILTPLIFRWNKRYTG